MIGVEMKATIPRCCFVSFTFYQTYPWTSRKKNLPGWNPQCEKESGSHLVESLGVSSSSSFRSQRNADCFGPSNNDLDESFSDVSWLHSSWTYQVLDNLGSFPVWLLENEISIPNLCSFMLKCRSSKGARSFFLKKCYWWWVVQSSSPASWELLQPKCSTYAALSGCGQASPPTASGWATVGLWVKTSGILGFFF